MSKSKHLNECSREALNEDKEEPDLGAKGKLQIYNIIECSRGTRAQRKRTKTKKTSRKCQCSIFIEGTRARNTMKAKRNKQ